MKKRQATSLYLQMIYQLERRRAQLGWPIWMLEDKAGISDGHYAHLITPDSLSGRQASWKVLQEIATALYGPVALRLSNASPDRIMRVPSCTALTRNHAIQSWMRTRLSEMGLKGGPARAAAMTPEQRSEAARKAAQARWARARAAKD